MNRNLISVIVWDVVPVVGAYYLLRAFGVSEYIALPAAGAAGLARVVFVAVSQRRLDGFAAFMVVMFGCVVGLSLIAGDARFVLATKSATTALAALILLGTWIAGRPAAFSVAKKFGAEDAATARRWDALYADQPGFRRIYVVMTIVWGLALLAESALRLLLVYLLPIDVMAGLSTILLLTTIGLAGAWSAWYGKRGEARALTAREAR